MITVVREFVCTNCLTSCNDYNLITLFKQYKIKGVDYKKIGNKVLGSGAEGLVYKYDKNKIIKITFPLNIHTKTLNKKLNILNNIKKTKSTHIAKLYSFGALKENIRNGMTIIYYISEKLSYVNDNKINYDKWHNIIDDLKKNKKLSYEDLHSDNVMKTKNGKQKICDLNGFLY